MRKNVYKISMALIAIVFSIAVLAACVSVKNDMEITIVNEQDGAVTYDYDGNEKSVEIDGAPQGVEVQVTYAGEGTTVYESSLTAPVNAGTYAVTVTATGGSLYNDFHKNVKLVINKAANDFTLSCADVVLGETIEPVISENMGGEPSFTYMGRGETVYDESDEAPTQVGTYTVTATVNATANYFGARKSVDFTIFSDDPLYGVPRNILDKISSLIKLEVGLAPSSESTNIGAFQNSVGLIKAVNTHLMLEADFEREDVTTFIIRSSATTLAYFRFAIDGKTDYADVVENGIAYNKYYAGDMQIPEGYSAIEVPMLSANGYEGDSNASVTGVHIIFKDNVEITVCGVYQKAPLTDSGVPQELKNAAAEKTELTTALSASSFYTNGINVRHENGIIEAKNNGISLDVEGITKSCVYMLVKSDIRQDVSFRFMIEGKHSYNNAMYEADLYNKYYASVIVEEGYSFITVPLDSNSVYTGDTNAPVTGIHIWGQGLLDYGITIYGVYAEPAAEPDEIPAALLEQLEGKTKVTTVLAEASYYTNTPEQISQEDGVIRATKTGISFDADGMDSGSQIYLLVKSDYAYTIDFRFTTAGKNAYGDVIAVGDYYKFYNSGVQVAEGYSILTVAMVAGTNSGYTGGENDPVTGLYLWSQGLLDYGITIYGVYAE